MQKKINAHDIDHPIDDIDCWDRYPKHRWVYEASRLLDAQNIKWSPFKTDTFYYETPTMSLWSTSSDESLNVTSGIIYAEPPHGRHMYNEIYLSKGEIKAIRHIDPTTSKDLPDLIGEVELRINAFVALYFTKFTGVITCETFGNEIRDIKLRSHSFISSMTNTEYLKLIKRIYKKTEQIQVNGLSDRTLQEILTS